MTIEDCFEIGYVLKPHGLNGEIVINLDVDDPTPYFEIKNILIPSTHLGSSLIPYIVQKIKITARKKSLSAIIKLEGSDRIEDFDFFKGKKIYLPLNQLPKLKENQFYYHEVIGYKIIDQSLGTLGAIKTIYNLPNQDLIAMMYKEVEVLIPIKDEILGDCNHSKKTLQVCLPAGLLEVYLDNDAN